MHRRNLCGTENGNRTTECYLWEKLQKARAEVERLKEQLESTKLLAVKFWNVLEENGFKIELPK
jgi:hypothetical protein